MKTLKIYPTSINQRFIDEAVDVMRDGGIIIYPTTRSMPWAATPSISAP